LQKIVSFSGHIETIALTWRLTATVIDKKGEEITTSILKMLLEVIAYSPTH
jgi:hypothetical protein